MELNKFLSQINEAKITVKRVGDPEVKKSGRIEVKIPKDFKGVRHHKKGDILIYKGNRYEITKDFSTGKGLKKGSKFKEYIDKGLAKKI